MNIIFIYLKYIVLLNLYLMYIINKNIHTIIRGYRLNIFKIYCIVKFIFNVYN
jgi:hypothetical protein